MQEGIFTTLKLKNYPAIGEGKMALLCEVDYIVILAKYFCHPGYLGSVELVP